MPWRDVFQLRRSDQIIVVDYRWAATVFSILNLSRFQQVIPISIHVSSDRFPFPHQSANSFTFSPILISTKSNALIIPIPTDSGVDADNKVRGRTSVYAVHEHQTSKTGAIGLIESNFGGLRCLSSPLISISSLLSHLL